MDAISDFFDTVLGLSATQAQDLTTAQVCLRAIVVYFLLVLFVRLGKKRFLGQATAFDAVLIIVIGSVPSRAVSGTAPFMLTIRNIASNFRRADNSALFIPDRGNGEGNINQTSVFLHSNRVINQTRSSRQVLGCRDDWRRQRFTGARYPRCKVIVAPCTSAFASCDLIVTDCLSPRVTKFKLAVNVGPLATT